MNKLKSQIKLNIIFIFSYEKMIEIDPSNIKYWASKGNLLKKQKKYDEVMKWLF